MATRSDASASAGPVTSHWTNATVAMARNTGMGARRRKTSGKVSAAANHRLGLVPPTWVIQPEHRTNSAAASVMST